ncbi:MAG: alpha-galactosidase [Kiritimatiellae bacterium]|nr:alpha-galactosidase [Kiritimatiellia bacterium]
MMQRERFAIRNGAAAMHAAACAMAAALAVAPFAGAADSRVEFRECPKCDKRIRIDLAANKAYVNLSRLEGADRNAVAARAARLLDAAKIPPARDPKLRPLMGWSSWNTFGVDISEEIILETARAMATNGLKAAGYTYVNIDDGFFWGHGEDGILRFHPERFPNGMKPVVDGIHALGLKAGIYSDAGADTCGSMWGGSGAGGKDKGGVGGGLYGHDAADCKLHFTDLGFDFIKVDYCGGIRLKLNEKARYTEIANAIKATGRTDVRLNLCRWAFPGTWAADIAESWRTTKDIRANWKSVKDLVGENLYLSAYAKPGHYNDMDMLEVGQLKGSVKSVFGKHGDTGLTPDEETTHFGIWCMLSSPLLIGCDVRTIPASTMALITNPYLLSANQNDLGCQAYVAQREGEAYMLVKDAYERFGTTRYVALYNGSDVEHEFTVRAGALDLGGAVDAFDLVEMADVGRFEDHVSVKVAPHASKFYRVDAERRVMRRLYEAETAFLADYQELSDAAKAGTAFPDQRKDASGGVIVRYIGNRATNYLEWSGVKVDESGEYVLSFSYASPEDRAFDLSVDGGAATRVAAPSTGGGIASVEVPLRLSAGVHAVRLSNASAWMPDVDCMTIKRR